MNNPKKNHAFLFVVHKQPGLLARTLKTLAQENHHFFVHVDKKTPDFARFEKASEGVANVKFIRRTAIFHGGISQVRYVIDLLQEAANADTRFDFIHLLSGQDYPLRSNEQFDAFFEQTDHSFMCFDKGDFLQYMLPTYKRMTEEFHFNDTHSLVSRIYEKCQIGRIIALFWKRQPIENFASGWDWFSWNEPTTHHVLNYLGGHPELMERFNHTQAPVEHIFHTILHDHIEELKIEDSNPLRYVSWHPHRPVDTDYRPYDLNELDYEDVIKRKAFFCRKVDEVKSAKLLDLIDAQRGTPFDMGKATSVFE